MKDGRGKEVWKWVKSGGEVGSRAGRPVDERPERKGKGEKEERKGKGKCFGGCFDVRVIEFPLFRKCRLYIGERERE